MDTPQNGMNHETATALVKAHLFAASSIKRDDERFKGILLPKAIILGVAADMRAWARDNANDVGLASAFRSVAGSVDNMLRWPDSPHILDHAIDALCEGALALNKYRNGQMAKKPGCH
jgi:hypothetical protein